MKISNKKGKNLGKGVLRYAFQTRFITVRMNGGRKINGIVIDSNLSVLTILDLNLLKRNKIDLANQSPQTIKRFSLRVVRIVDIAYVAGDGDFYAI